MDKYLIYFNTKIHEYVVTKARIKSKLSNGLYEIYYRTIDKRVKQGMTIYDNIYNSLKEAKQVIGNIRCYYCI